MSRQTFIFVQAQPHDAHLEHLVEQALGQRFTREEGSDPFIRTGTAAVYVGGHEFDDDDITGPEGTDVPLHSKYPTMIEVRDTAGDYQHQVKVADKVFNALRSQGRWGTVYVDDMQKVVNTYDPGDLGSQRGASSVDHRAGSG
jgi:hypothetical protein